MIKIKGIIVKIHSDLYKVDVGTSVIDCKAKGLLKFKHMKPVVGDYVEVKDNVIEKKVRSPY